MSEHGPSPVEAREAETLLIQEIYFSLRKINRDLFQKITQVVENPESVDFDVDSLIDEILHEPAFDMEKFRYLNERSSVRHFIVHDLGAFASSIFTAKSFLTMPGMKEYGLKIFFHNWPAYSLALEDTHLRFLENDPQFSADLEPLNLDFFKRSIVGFASGSACRGRVKELFAKQFFSVQEIENLDNEKFLEKMSQKLNFDQYLSADEQVMTNSSVIANSVFNIIRNACKDSHEAKNINFLVVREGDELVFRVCDDGIGMGTKQLDEQSENCIFVKGSKSSTETQPEDETGKPMDVHGLGLANTPERFKKYANAAIKVWSRSKDLGGKYNVFPNNNTEDVPVKNMPNGFESSETVSVSTVFEIRLPITKKVS